MQTTAITGGPELLLQLRDDLIKAGFVDDKEWNEERINMVFTNIVVYPDFIFTFYILPCDYEDVKCHITPENYAAILSELIERYKPIHEENK